MASRKAKLQAKAEKTKKNISDLIDQKLDVVTISERLDLEINKVLYYCALMKKIPIKGDIDLNWYLNGKAEYSRQKKLKKEEADKKKPFKPDDEWYNTL